MARGLVSVLPERVVKYREEGGMGGSNRSAVEGETGCRLHGLTDVRGHELELIAKRRKRILRRTSGDLDTSQTPAESGLVGLALSGGGIRSAATSLGILQGLSKTRVLEFVDFLSTVSGGGYTGACLSSLLSLKKSGPPGGGDDPYSFSSDLDDPAVFSTRWEAFPFRDCQAGKQEAAGQDALPFSGKDEMGHIRGMASYLVPRNLPCCADVLKALGATAITTLVPLTFTLLVLTTLTLFYMAFSAPLVKHLVQGPEITTLAGKDGSAGAKPVDNLDSTDAQARKTAANQEQSQKGAVYRTAKKTFLDFFSLVPKEGWIKSWLVFGLVFGLAVSFPFSVLFYGAETDSVQTGKEARKMTGFFFLLVILLILLTFFASTSLAGNHEGGGGLLLPAAFALSTFLGAGAAFIVMALLSDKRYWTVEHRSFVQNIAGICLYALAGTLVLGLLHTLILVGHTVWIPALLGANIAGLKLWPTIKKWVLSPGSGGASVLAEKLERWVSFILVPALIILTVALIGSLINHQFLDGKWVNAEKVHRCFVAGIILSAFSLIVSWLLNLNRLTPHYFYRDRLAEAFLRTVRRGDAAAGETTTILRDASRMPLVDLHGRERDRKTEAKSVSAARGPYLLVNTAINLTASRDLKGFQRKADVFTFSCLYSGSEETGYIATSVFDDDELELARVMTISGAAVTSIMGSLGSMASSFACGIFGIRLGYWMENPRYSASRRRLSRLRFWPWWFLLELFNHSHERSRLVYLSDGGHSGDNLGILPLLRRRVRLIIASDAEQDRGYLFDSLNSSLRRAYVDEGIRVDIDLSAFEREEKKSACAVGRILYPDRPWQKSLLIVIKNCLCVDENLATIKNYKKKSPDFPHETTGDQFFTEEQFESYRALGRRSAERIFSDWYPLVHPPDPWKTLFEYCSRQKAGTPHRWDDVIQALYDTDRGCFDSWVQFKETIEGCFDEDKTGLAERNQQEKRELLEVRELLREKEDALPLCGQWGFVPHTLSEVKRVLRSCGPSG